MMPWLHIVGIGEDGLDVLPAVARNLIDNAEVLIGGDRHLAMIPGNHPAERHRWESPLRKTVARLETMRGRRVVVLATGDPMSYGIGVTLTREFGTDAVAVLPVAGAFSLAAASRALASSSSARRTSSRACSKSRAYLSPGAR